MGKSCCVTECKSNYEHVKGKYVSCFKIPECEERKKLWLRKIPRDFNPTKNNGVCILHFEEKFIVRVDEVKRDDGSILRVPRERLKLTNDAYPTIFPNCPKYLSEQTPAKRKRPEQRWEELQQRDDQGFAEVLANDKITNFTAFCQEFESRTSGSSWRLGGVSETHCSLLKIQDVLPSVPRLVAAVRVHADMQIQVFTDEGNTGIGKSIMKLVFRNILMPRVFNSLWFFIRLLYICSCLFI